MARTTKLESENRAASTLDGAITAVAGTLDVQVGDAASFGGTDFHISVGDDAQGYEIMKVTNVAGVTFTVTRAQEGTGALPFTNGTDVRLTITKEYLEQLRRPLEIVEDGWQHNLLPEAFLMEWGSNGDNWPGTCFNADSAALDNAQQYCGSLSLKMVADNTEYWCSAPAIGSYTIPLIPTQKYVASMYCREAAGAATVRLRVRQSDGDYHDGADTAVDNTGWTRVYVAFTADSALCSIIVENRFAGNKTYYCDAFMLEMVDSTVTVPSDYTPPAATVTELQDLDIAGDATVEGAIIADGDSIEDSGGAAVITFDGAQNTALAGDLTLAAGEVSATSATYPVVEGVRTTAVLNATKSAISVHLLTAGNMVDGFGPNLAFTATDSGVADVLFGFIGAIRDTADTEGALVFYCGTNGDEEFMRLDHLGNLQIDNDLTVSGNNINDAGAGAITFDGAGNTSFDGNIALTNTKTFLRGVAIISQAITWNGGAIQACATVADGYVVTDVYIEITTTFDGDAVVTVGDGGVANGFLTDADINQGALGYYGYDVSARGAYIANGDRKIYTGADTVDAFVTETTATQGAATVWTVIQRLK